MRTALPPIHEDATTLKQRFKAEPHPARRQRLQVLYLLASGQARTRRAAAALVGVARNTVGLWLTTYQQGGLTALLDVSIPAGKAKPLTADQIAQLQAKLDDPTGFASYTAIQCWIRTTFGVEMTYNAVHKLVRYKLGAKLKVPRPTHPKKTLKRL